MKKILVFVLLLASTIGWGQTDESRTINNANFPVALYSGIPEISIPLFKINTVSNDFSLDVQLENNLYASTNKHFSTRGIGDAWSLNILGSITLKPEIPGLVASVRTYDETHYSELLLDNEDKEGHTTYTYSVFGLTGKFVIEKNGTVFKTKILEQNDYAEVSVNYSTANNLFRLNSFTITDKNGTKYVFAVSDKTGIVQGSYGNPTVYFAEKRTFFLSQVRDKYNRDLLVYNYTGNDPVSPQPNVNYNYELESINVNGKGTISLSPLNAAKRTLTYRDLKSNLIQKIEFMFISGFYPFNKLLVNEVRLYDTTESSYKSYNISYKTYNQVNADKNYLGFLHNICNHSRYLGADLYYDHGAVEKIITPEKGVTFYEYEPNTIGTTTPQDMAHWDPDGPIYKLYMKELRMNKAENYTFEQIPLVYNSSYGGYVVDLTNYLPSDYDHHDQIIFVDYDATPVVVVPALPPFRPEPEYYHPILKVERYSNFPTGYDVQTVEKKVCEPGTLLSQYYGYNRFLLKIETQYQSYYNYVRAYYKKAKNDEELIYYNYSVGPRIKRIKSFAQNVANINSADHIVNEKLFNYELFDQPRSSSGRFIADNVTLPNYQDYTLYKNVSVETPGKGKINYEFGDAGENVSYTNENSHLFKYVRNLKKYNIQNQLTESVGFERNFTGTAVNYEKTITESFENGASSGLRAITESTFDTLTRHLTHRKITDSGTGDTFEEAYTYQKLGNAFYQTGVAKKKNNQALNRSVYAYQQYENTQVYNLKAVSTAKENRPLQVEREITRHDTYGNITGYKTKDGMLVSQIWGYNNSMLVAELKNVDPAVLYTSAHATVRNNIANYSNQSGAGYSEADLTTALNSLRNTFPDAYITTYTYKPLVGITSVTDANGRKETYQYDSFNRLWRVLNHEGLIVKEYEYNIKN